MTKLSASQFKLLEKSTKQYQESLSEAWYYLESRGITEETAERFRLGYVKEPAKGDEEFRSRICIPYIRQAGIVAQRFRTLGASELKYHSRLGIESGLFHVEALFSASDTCVITEGEFDTIILSQIGIPSVGISGTTGWKPHYRRIFEDFDRLIVFRDNDDAGKVLARNIKKDFPYTVVVPMPVDDVNSTYLSPEYGEDYLREAANLP
jgi:replicative DNA helicase